MMSASAMISVSESQIFALTNKHFSYVLCISPEGVLEHVYYGNPLTEPFKILPHYRRTKRDGSCEYEGVQHYNLSEVPQEYPTFGRSDFRTPAFHGVNGDGNTVFSFLFKSYEVLPKKPVLKGLPSARGEASETLKITLTDTLHNVEVDLFYTIWAEHSVLARSTRLRNMSDIDIKFQNCFSSAIDFPPEEYELLHLRGTWAREFNVNRIDIPKARFVIESARGSSSAAHHPFLALMERGTTEAHGRVYATTLVYSGNFAISVEQGEFEDVRVLSGINPFNFEWCLKPEEVFDTPEALHVFTAHGLGDMSAKWHDFIRSKVTPKRFKNVPRSTYLNTWEASYFDVTENKILDLADKAVEIGVDMLVLDDGWFEGRHDDSSSLGDWRADKTKFPSGIPALAKQVKAKGLKFGLWFEPEMVNPKSDLYQSHPDWVLQIPRRKASLGRNQLTLDLSQPDVQDYLFDSMDAILSCGDVDYVKWDMNRNMTETGSLVLMEHQQREVPHRYILGLYALLDRLMTAYPNILFENCASGGNRFDLGMLSFMAQGWISDMCDPIGRLRLMSGASYLYPLDTMAAYIGPSPNHQNGRISSIQTRFLAGVFCAAKGVSLNAVDIEKHKSELQTWMLFSKETAEDMLGGRFDRLIDKENEVCWQYLTADETKLYVVYFHILSAPNMPFHHVRLTHLEPSSHYRLLKTGQIFQGDNLMYHGLSLPYVTMNQSRKDVQYMPKGDFSSYLFVFQKED